MSDGDQTARVRIVPVESDLRVEVVLRDGRSTTRLIRDTEALLPTLEALLTVPVLPSGPWDRSTAPAVADDPPDLLPRVRQKNQEAQFGVEIGGGVGARMAGPGSFLSGSPSVFAQGRVGQWLAGLTMRWETLLDFTGLAPDGFEADTIAFGLTVARRMPVSFGQVDVGVSPRLVSQTQTYLPPAGEASGTSTDIRPGGFARVSFGHGVIHLLVEADAEVSPADLQREIRILPDLPRLPGWSAGLSVGASWGEQ